MLKDFKSLPMRIEQGKETEQFFFKIYKKLFFTAVKWNIFESFFYQIIFLAHQLGLYLWCDRALYGKAGSLFAFSYLMIMVLLGGVEGGLLPFFQQFSCSRKNFSIFLNNIIMRQLLFVFLFVSLATFVSFFFVTKTFSCGVIVLVALFTLIECYKKLLKHLLYLAFYNKYTATIEVLQLIFYVTTIWISYWCGVPFSLSLFFIPFIVLSFFSSWLYWKLILNYYQTLDDNPIASLPPPSTAKVLRMRATVLLNQLCRSFFSGNCIVPLFALFSGFTKAGTMTFIHYLTNTVTFFLYKICIPPAEALLSKIHYFSTATQYHALRLVLSLFACLTIFLGIILFFNAHHLAPLFGCSMPTKTDLFFFFFFIHLLETMFIVYEKFFLMWGKIGFLTLGNSITCILCFFITQTTFPFITIVLLCFFIRFLFFSLLSALIVLVKPAAHRFKEKRR